LLQSTTPFRTANHIKNMKKKVLIFVATEYHLLLAINEILTKYYDDNRYEVRLYVKLARLSRGLDFSDLPISSEYYDIAIDIDNLLDENIRNKIQLFLNNPPDIFIFFQEQDPLMVILSSGFSKKGSEIFLYQDGFKPHAELKLHSLGLLKYHHKLNVWMWKNGFSVESWLSPVYSKKYAFLKSTNRIFLTFPEYYENWNKKDVEKIVFLPIKTLNPYLRKVFGWDDSLLAQKENIILYLSQKSPIDGEYEIEFLRSLQELYPKTPIYIKLHPNTNIERIKQYKQLMDVYIIDSRILAELFIMNVKQSIIMSLFSTSMFLNNPENKFYYFYKLFKGKSRQLRRMTITEVPIDHIKVVTSIGDIKF